MRSDMYNVRSLYRACLLMTFAKTEYGGSDKMPNDIQTCVRYRDGY